jgi:hypothetical protein
LARSLLPFVIDALFCDDRFCDLQTTISLKINKAMLFDRLSHVA